VPSTQIPHSSISVVKGAVTVEKEDAERGRKLNLKPTDYVSNIHKTLTSNGFKGFWFAVIGRNRQL
jgi:hypothetical protein